MVDDERNILAQRTGKVAARAVQTFGDPRQGLEWLTDELGILGGRAPADLLDTEEGAQEVIRILGRIDHGVYS
jgi:putative toxin-antitoxin system antitoxin component (TIGR02293 family)